LQADTVFIRFNTSDATQIASSAGSMTKPGIDCNQIARTVISVAYGLEGSLDTRRGSVFPSGRRDSACSDSPESRS
jgi:hypothetical protein